MEQNVVIERTGVDFRDWDSVLRLLHAAFAYQESRIDPPSSLYQLDEDALANKATEEQLMVAKLGGDIVGCVFAKHSSNLMYLGKLAVCPHLQGRGIGYLLLQAVESFAREQGTTLLALEARIELTENHDAFSKFGFTKTSERAHEGYARPTYITMQKRIHQV